MERLVFLVALITLNSGSVWAFVLNGNGDCSSLITHTYRTTNSALSNPFRGWYFYAGSHDTNFSPLTAGSLQNRIHHHAVEDITVIYRIYYLDSYRNKSLDSVLLDKMRADLGGIRDAGKSVLLRFAYTSENAAPYKDTDVGHILDHIQSLQRHGIFSDFEGIIAAVYAGFIGVWGEWYFTSFFGDHGHISSTDWQHRRQVVDALLSAVPDSSDILLRTPYYKYHLWGEATTTYQDLLNRSKNHKARIGFHNDCFLASKADKGTYNHGVVHDKTYLQKETTYTVMTGETCHVDPPRSECGTAEKELGLFHWSILNFRYHPDVYKSWKAGGCYERVTRNLGYRLGLKSVKLPSTAQRSSGICFDAILRNYGYAAPIKEFTVSLILKADSGKSYSHDIPNLDVRTWLPGNDHHFKGSVDIANVPNGSYKVYLALRNKLMSSNFKYNILLANDGVPEMSTRLNDLKHRITIH